jgi:hypothetical protein
MDAKGGFLSRPSMAERFFASMGMFLAKHPASNPHHLHSPIQNDPEHHHGKTA